MTTTLSPEFVKIRADFAAWYDSKPEEIQALIDEISDKTYFIIEEDEYDEFISLLSDYGITTAEQFEYAFQGEYEGDDEHLYTKFAEGLCDSLELTSRVPDSLINSINFEFVYRQSLRYDYMDFEFRGNRYFFRKYF